MGVNLDRDNNFEMSLDLTLLLLLDKIVASGRLLTECLNSESLQFSIALSLIFILAIKTTTSVKDLAVILDPYL